jgi:hypothetical protein
MIIRKCQLSWLYHYTLNICVEISHWNTLVCTVNTQSKIMIISLKNEEKMAVKNTEEEIFVLQRKLSS